MRLVVDPNQAPTAQVISLTDARHKFVVGKCRHMRVTIDESLAELTCDDCKEKLNPIAVLARYAQEESRLTRLQESIRTLQAQLDAKQRCRCQHCGGLTRWRP